MPRPPYEAAKREWERAYWSGLIIEHDGNIAAMARAAGVHRQNVYPILERLELSPKSVQPLTEEEELKAARRLFACRQVKETT